MKSILFIIIMLSITNLNAYVKLDLTESDNYTENKCLAIHEYCSDANNYAEDGCYNISDADTWNILLTDCESGGKYYDTNESDLNDYLLNLENNGIIYTLGNEWYGFIQYIDNWIPPATSTEELLKQPCHYSDDDYTTKFDVDNGILNGDLICDNFRTSELQYLDNIKNVNGKIIITNSESSPLSDLDISNFTGLTGLEIDNSGVYDPTIDFSNLPLLTSFILGEGCVSINLNNINIDSDNPLLQTFRINGGYDSDSDSLNSFNLQNFPDLTTFEVSSLGKLSDFSNLDFSNLKMKNIYLGAVDSTDYPDDLSMFNNLDITNLKTFELNDKDYGTKIDSNSSLCSNWFNFSKIEDRIGNSTYQYIPTYKICANVPALTTEENDLKDVLTNKCYCDANSFYSIYNPLTKTYGHKIVEDDFNTDYGINNLITLSCYGLTDEDYDKFSFLNNMYINSIDFSDTSPNLYKWNSINIEMNYDNSICLGFDYNTYSSIDPSSLDLPQFKNLDTFNIWFNNDIDTPISISNINFGFDLIPSLKYIQLSDLSYPSNTSLNWDLSNLSNLSEILITDNFGFNKNITNIADLKLNSNVFSNIQLDDMGVENLNFNSSDTQITLSKAGSIRFVSSNIINIDNFKLNPIINQPPSCQGCSQYFDISNSKITDISKIDFSNIGNSTTPFVMLYGNDLINTFGAKFNSDYYYAFISLMNNSNLQDLRFLNNVKTFSLQLDNREYDLKLDEDSYICQNSVGIDNNYAPIDKTYYCGSNTYPDGTVCDDNNSNTINDIYTSQICAGTVVYDGDSCDDNNSDTIGETWLNGVCQGGYIVGDDCDDGNNETVEDKILSNGICKGIVLGDGFVLLITSNPETQKFIKILKDSKVSISSVKDFKNLQHYIIYNVNTTNDSETFTNTIDYLKQIEKDENQSLKDYFYDNLQEIITDNHY